jgi:DNA uptake protein ComE-like DNA-binding protein
MNIKKTFGYFSYTKEQAIGVLTLFLVVIILQFCHYFMDFNRVLSDSPEKQTWIANQRFVDSLKTDASNAKPIIYPFNPNFISDFKGYKLGMSVAEIDRLLAFRKLNKYVNSPEEFQSVTLVSDSLLNTMSSYFKFPDWVKNKKRTTYAIYSTKTAIAMEGKGSVKDINLATKEDLMEVFGVGQVLSDRILKMRETVGGIVSMDQINEVWGLTPEVVDKIKLSFKVLKVPSIIKIDINNASIKELAQFTYFKYGLAREIVIYRSMNGDFVKIEDLTKIKGFPVEKANIIALYLDFR